MKHLDNTKSLHLEFKVKELLFNASRLPLAVPGEVTVMNFLPNITENFNEILRPKYIFEEVKTIASLVTSDFNPDLLTSVYQDIVKLFEGKYVGYQKCDTGYHDLLHTKECLLETARLIHGTSLNGHSFCEKDINLGLISAIMHDTGYIQSTDETAGSGAKYTATHIDRSIRFMRKYLAQRGFMDKDIRFCENCLKCTGLFVKINKIKFLSYENEVMGKILGIADLIGQMASTLYLEKLPSLFKEFQEAGIAIYDNEFDLLGKTPGFWEVTKDRFQTELGGFDRYLRDHFRVRWGIDRDLNREAIEKNIDHLKHILKHHRQDYHRFLKPQEKLAGS